jgi:arginyl-tRNA synthetase
MKEEIRKVVEKALIELKNQEKWSAFDMPEIEVDYPKDEQFGDYTTNISMILAKNLKTSPLKIAQNLAGKISSDLIEEVEVAAPGYINFFLEKNYFQKLIKEINKKKEKFGDSDFGKGERVLLEFVSANPTGPIHLGNGRGGPLGDSLARVMEKVGYKTEREYYINDWGHQIEVLGHSILKDDEAQYRGDYVDDLAEKRDKNLKNPIEIGNWAAHVIIDSFIKPTAKKLGIHFNNWFSEESLHKAKKVDDIIKLLKDKKICYEKDGATWYESTKFGDDKDRVLIKSDGNKTYIATDFAYHKNKVERGFSKLINIQGADHHKEAEVVKKFVENILDKKVEINYILTQLVHVYKDGQEVKMSKRKGVYFALDDLVDEVGRDAVRFIFLSYSAQSSINFDIDLAKERSEKNPVYYVQYAHARISSIIRKAKAMNFKFEEGDLSVLTHEKELTLMRELAKFPSLLEEISQNYETHRLPFYAIKLADKFHSFYNECKVLDEKNSELTRARLNLVNAVKIVLAETLDLMGINAPEKM